MATLVLTVAGTLIGGPIGGMIGATLGQVVDQQLLFRPKTRSVQGPRVNDLRVQTSTYGTPIPALFGAMRVAGTVIWATNIIERSHRSKGGKGQPKVTTYSYAANFAVALSSRRVAGVGRIWADGKLLRGAAGDFKTAVDAFRFYTGGEDQPVDPLLSATTSGRSPAHRGIAYAVFDALQLADYGNRIPSLTFEVFGESGAVPVARIAHDLSDGLFDGAAGAESIDGYAAIGSVGEALAPLVEAFGLSVVAGVDDGTLALSGSVGEGMAIPQTAQLGRANGKAVPPARATRRRVDQAPAKVSLRYYEPGRDYQASVQAALRPGGGDAQGDGEAAIDLPATMSAAGARALAEARVQAEMAGRERMELRCGWSALTLMPGETVTVPGRGGRWRIDDWAWDEMQLKLGLRRVAAGPVTDADADAGDAIAAPDAPHGPTRLALIELPVLGDAGGDAPVVMAAAAGPEAGWRSAALFARRIDGQLEPIGTSAAPAIVGTLAVAPGAGSSLLFDETAAMEVLLAGADMELQDANDAALALGANLCVVGRELMQFGRAEPLGGGRWRLARLLRGRRGTEHLMAGHSVGEPFVLVEEDRLFAVPSAWASAGAETRIAAIGIGDAEPVEAALVPQGLAMAPLSPVHLSAAAMGTGWHFGWTRRSRAGWRWADGADAPLGEETERWRIDWRDAGGVFRSAEMTSAGFDYTSVLADADRLAGHGGPVTVEIRQIGTHGPGVAAGIAIAL